MIRIYKTEGQSTKQLEKAEEGCWIAMTDPTATELYDVSQEYGIEVDDLRAPLDEEERSRIELEDDYTLILVDIPVILVCTHYTHCINHLTFL